MQDRVGEQFGHYRLVRLLGTGGFAEVYLGEHVYLNTQAAIKVLQTRLEAGEQENFLNEARMIARLIHPHIVRVLDFGVEQGIPYLIMDYAPNGTLRQRFPRGVPQSPLTILPYIKQIASALDYAHEQHLIHRDVKPENMLLNSNDEVVLSDFGIALILRSTHFDGLQEVYGTATYPQDRYPTVEAMASAFEEACDSLVAADPLLSSTEEGPGEGEELTIRRAASPEGKPLTDGLYAPTHYAEGPAFSLQHSEGNLSFPATQPAPVHTPHLPELPEPSTSLAGKAKISRRKFLIGLGAAGIAVAAGGTTWALIAREQSASTSPTTRFTAPPSPTPSTTPNTVGTTLFIYRGHSGAVYAASWSPSGTNIASGGADRTVQVWEATTGQHIFTYYGHTGLSNVVTAVTWSPDGKRIASGSTDQTVQVWDAATGNNAYTYRGHSDAVYVVEWATDGQHIASGGADKTVRVWGA